MLLLYSKNVCSMLSATCSRAATEDHNAQQRGRQGLVPPALLQQAALADAAGRESQSRACTLQQPPREGSSQAATSGALPAFGLQLASGCPARPAAGLAPHLSVVVQGHRLCQHDGQRAQIAPVQLLQHDAVCVQGAVARHLRHDGDLVLCRQPGRCTARQMIQSVSWYGVTEAACCELTASTR